LEVSASHITNDEKHRGGECGDSTEQLPPLEILATQILKCQTWGSALALIDDVAIATGLKRGSILKTLFKTFTGFDRVRFLALLDLHIEEFAQDERALIARDYFQKLVAEVESERKD
jgi:hypothetical protein